MFTWLDWLAKPQQQQQQQQTKRRAYKFPTIFSHLNGEIVRDWRWLRWIWAARATLPAAGLNLAKASGKEVGKREERERKLGGKLAK